MYVRIGEPFNAFTIAHETACRTTRGATRINPNPSTFTFTTQ